MRNFLLTGFAGLLFIFSLIGKNPVQAPESTLTLEDYWQLVEETQALVAQLKAVPSKNPVVELEPLASRWEAVKAIQLPDGTTHPIDLSFFAGQLRAGQPDLARLSADLETLLAARSQWPQEKYSPADLKSLASILEKPEFQWQSAPPDPLQELWQNIQRRFWSFIANLFKGKSLEASLPFLRIAVIGAGVLAVGLALAYALRGIWGSLVAEAELEATGEPGDEDLNADSALRKAQDLSGSGDYRNAVRYLYLSSLLRLEERGVLRYDRSRTNREYLRSVEHLPELATNLREVVDVFDRVWYGFQSLDEHAYARYAAYVADLRGQK